MKYAVTYNKWLDTAGRVALVTDVFDGVPSVSNGVLMIHAAPGSDMILLISTSFLTVEPFVGPPAIVTGV